MNWNARHGDLRIGGHRGDPERAPENTMASFAMAVAAGVDYIETDVQRSSDGELVIIHDETLDRTTDRHGPVSEATSKELFSLDAGSWFSEEFRGERLVGLDMFLNWISKQVPVGAVIEAKASGVGAELADRIWQSPARAHLAICSFWPEEIAAAKEARFEVPCILLFPSSGPSGDPIELLEACRADGADLPWQWLDVELAGRMRERGLAIGGGTADDAASVGKLAKLGADFVDSDRPTISVSARQELGIVAEERPAST